MSKEYEVTILEIDNSFENKLIELGAKLVSDSMQKRYVYDVIPVNPNKWIRLRTNGNKTTLTVKEIKDKSAIGGTEEVEIIVDSFDNTNNLLESLGYISRNYQENYRKMYNLNGIEISVDSWPMIPTYAEIEGKCEEDVLEVLKLLGYAEKDYTTLDVVSIYELYNIDIMKIKELKFKESQTKSEEGMLEYNE